MTVIGLIMFIEMFPTLQNPIFIFFILLNVG